MYAFFQILNGQTFFLRLINIYYSHTVHWNMLSLGQEKETRRDFSYFYHCCLFFLPIFHDLSQTKRIFIIQRRPVFLSIHYCACACVFCMNFYFGNDLCNSFVPFNISYSDNKKSVQCLSITDATHVAKLYDQSLLGCFQIFKGVFFFFSVSKRYWGCSHAEVP